MSSINKLNDYYPPIIIDIGTKTTKSIHPITHLNNLEEEIKFEINSQKSQVNENIHNFNKNFEGIKCINSFETYSTIDRESEIEFKQLKFPHEIIFKDDIEKWSLFWQTIVEKVGNAHFGEDYFKREGFSETPVIIMHDSVNSRQKQEEVEKIYENLFQKFQAQYVMICSSAMVNLFSYNISDGIVVDLGESKTSITSVRDGFTNYQNSFNYPFLSGRIITTLFHMKANNYYKKIMTYQDYINAENKKHESFSNHYNKDLHYFHLNPGVIKCINKHKEDEENNLLNFIIKNMTKINEIFQEISEKDITKNKENKSFSSILIDYEKYSLIQLIKNQIKLEYDINDSKNKINVAFCGGVLNTPNMKIKIKNDLETDKINCHFPTIDKVEFNFYKGAYYLSKLAGIENLMLSKHDYYEFGENRMCFNYI
jgi:actin-related protein